MKILVIDDHPLIVEALAQLLPQLDAGYRHAGRGRSGRGDRRARQRARRGPRAPRSRPAGHARPRFSRRPQARLSRRADRRALRDARPGDGAGCARRRRPGLHPEERECRSAARCRAAGARRRRVPAVRRVAHAEGRRRAHRAGRARPHRAPDRRAEAHGPGQAEQAHLPRPHALGGNRQGPRQRDPQGVARAFAHGSDRRARAARHQRRHAGGAARRDRARTRADRPAASRLAPTDAAHRRPTRDSAPWTSRRRRRASSARSHLLAHARADQVATLYGSWHRTTASMVLGALILCGVLWQQEAPGVMAVWLAAILANQAWRGVLVRAYRRANPPVGDAARWGAYWAVGLDPRRCAVGCGRRRDVSGAAGLSGALHRLPVRRDPGRAESRPPSTSRRSMASCWRYSCR